MAKGEVGGSPNGTILAELQRRARQGQTAYYSEIAALMGMSMDRIDERNDLSDMLGRISEYEVANERPMLSAIVVTKSTELPGPGFFTLAASLKRFAPGQNKRTFYKTECDRVFDFWRDH